MRIAVGQFAAAESWSDNAATCTRLVRQAADGGADLLVLPEGVLARFAADRHRIVDAAQPLDGPFVSALAESTAGSGPTVVVGVHEPGHDGRVFNTLVVLADGAPVSVYRKLHLYDAFADRESDHVVAGDDIPEPFDCAGLRVGLLTCYDVRFPEAARLQVDRGADVLALPAAWVRGPDKERHWDVLVAARALENTCYVAASGECSSRNIGASMVVDPLGVIVSRLGAQPGLTFADADPDHLHGVRDTLPVLANRRFVTDPTPRTPASPDAPLRPSA